MRNWLNAPSGSHDAGSRRTFKPPLRHCDGLGMRDDPFSRFVHESPDGVLITRLADGLIVDANEAFLRMIGWRREEAVGRTTLEIGLWEDPTARTGLMEQVEKSGSATGVLFRLLSSDGAPRIVEATVQRIELNGEACVLSVDRDVTERERAADEH